MSDSRKALNCPNCGSSNIEIIGNKATCNHCNTKFAPSKVEITNITNITNVAHTNKMRVDCYEVKNNLSKEIFLKKAMIFLTCNKDVSKDIFNCEFSEPALDYTYISTADCDCEMDYSLSIGIETKVKKQVEEQYLDRRSNTYKTHLVDKIVTETKWEPYSGKYTGSSKRTIIQDNSLPASVSEKFLSFFKSISPSEIKSSKEEYPELEVQDLDKIADDCVHDVARQYRDYININNYKNLKIHSGTAHISHITTYKVPLYSLTFKLNGKSHTLYCFGNNYKNMVIDDIQDDDKEEIINEFTQRKDKIHKPITIGLIASFVAFAIFTIVGFVNKATSLTPYIVWFVINMALFIGHIIWSKFDANTLNARVSEFEENSYSDKKRKCITFCVERKLGEPTDREFNEFR